MKILKLVQHVPKEITYRGYIYKIGPSYGNLENVRREKRHFLIQNRNLHMVIKKYYINPERPYAYYVLYVRGN